MIRSLTLSKAAYPNSFESWFQKKLGEEVYVIVDDAKHLSGMLYLKEEVGTVDDVSPPLELGKWLKVGTLKIEAQGTKLGERVLKKIFDTAIAKEATGIYVTIFDVHNDLIGLFERYGFRSRRRRRQGTELSAS